MMNRNDVDNYIGFNSDSKVLHNIYFDAEFSALNKAFQTAFRIFKNIKDRNMLGRTVVPRSVYEALSITEAFEKYPYNFYHTKFGKYEVYIERQRSSYVVSTLNFDIPGDILHKYKKKGAYSEYLKNLFFDIPENNSVSKRDTLNLARMAYIDLVYYLINIADNRLPLY